MNTDYRIKLGFFRHYKTRKLEKKLGADGVLALIKLWEYASEFRPDGDLSGMADEDIELSIMWDTEQTLMPILVSIGFVDGQEGEYRLHDWQEHNPWAAEADERSGEARLSRLFRTNPEKAKELKAQGRTGITQEEYQEFKKPAQKYDRSTTVQRPYNDRSTDRSTPAPAPAPAPPPKEDTLVVVVTDQELSARDGPPPPPPIRIARTPKAETAAFETMRALWAEICGPAGLNELRDVGRWPKKRRDAAWTLWAVEAKGDPEKIRKLFRYVVSCPRLIGGSKPRPGYSEPWRMNFDWLLGEDALARLMEGEFAPAVAAHA